MNSLVESRINKLWLQSYSKEEYRKALIELCEEAKEIGINNQIKFSYRQFRAKKLKDKAVSENDFKKLMADLDDLVSKNVDSWKAIRDKYAYFNKQVQ
jgi:hypothetical protein